MSVRPRAPFAPLFPVNAIQVASFYENLRVVGAIGVGSGTPEQDVKVARAGISALEAATAKKEQAS